MMKRVTHPCNFTDASVRETRERLASFGRARDFKAVLDEEAIVEPTRICDVCKDHPGAARLVDWQGRPTPQGMCPTCRGFRFVRMTTDEIRAAYARTRADACKALETSPASFDALVRMYLPEDPKPGHWLHYAKIILKKGTAR